MSFIDKDTQNRIENSFKDHVATLSQFFKLDENNEVLDLDGVSISTLTWKKPNTSIYFVRYVIMRGILFVYGDVGEAVYRWSDFVDFKKLASYDISYCHKKCQASEVGRRFDEWDKQVALENLKFHTRDTDFSMKKFKEYEGDRAIYDKDGWAQWLSHDDNMEEFFGADAWEWVFDIGTTINTRCLYHFIGLKMAVKQLQEKEII